MTSGRYLNTSWGKNFFFSNFSAVLTRLQTHTYLAQISLCFSNFWLICPCVTYWGPKPLSSHLLWPCKILTPRETTTHGMKNQTVSITATTTPYATSCALLCLQISMNASQHSTCHLPFPHPFQSLPLMEQSKGTFTSTCNAEGRQLSLYQNSWASLPC